MNIDSKIYTIPNRVLVDNRGAFSVVVHDHFTIPTGATGAAVILALTELPQTGIELPGYEPAAIAVELDASPHTEFDMVTSGIPASGEFLADSDLGVYGRIAFSKIDAGTAVKIIYKGRGSIVHAADVNELADGTLIEDGAILPRHVAGNTGAYDFTGGIVLADVNGRRYRLNVDPDGVTTITPL